MILLVKIIVEILCAICKVIGEKWQHNFQRFILPVIYSVGVSYVSSTWWLGLTTLPMIGAICLGYKDYGKDDAVARALWLFVICVIAGLVPTITGHLSWFIYIPYIIIAGFIGTLTRNINNWIEAPICGLWIGFPIWFLH